MAELHVQKREANVWPWVIGAVVLVAALWFAFGMGETVDRVAPTSADSVYTSPPPGMPTNPTPPAP